MTTTKRRKAMTLAEHDEVLKAEGRYDAFMEEQAKRDEAFDKQVAADVLAEAPMVADLRAAGAQIKDSVWELVKVKEPYPQLIPVLMEHLDKPYRVNIREGIARALAVREARPYWHTLVNRFLAEPEAPNQMKWALHLAVANSADESVLEDLIRLAVDRRLGRNRALMLAAFVRIGGPLAKATIEELRSDPDMAAGFEFVFKEKRR